MFNIEINRQFMIYLTLYTPEAFLSGQNIF